jgi:hypothetical protein
VVLEDLGKNGAWVDTPNTNIPCSISQVAVVEVLTYSASNRSTAQIDFTNDPFPLRIA